MKHSTLLLLAFLALALLTLAPRPAQAQWVLDHYVCAGTYSINGVSTPWPTPTQSVSFYYGGSATLQCVGTVQVFFRWTGTGPAPSTLNALITSSAAAYGTGPNPDDGFHDSIVVAYSRTSAGSHLVQVANPTNSTLVAVPPTGQAAYSLSAITTGGISVSFQATVVNAVLQGYSTHVSPALTGSEPASTAVWDPANPRYFSGTGCEAKTTAVPITGSLNHVQLCVNDQVVEEYWDSAAAGKPSPLPTDGSVVTGTSLTSTTLKALFDSTHFADSNPITIKLKVTDSNSGYYEATVAAIAKNRAYILANHTLDNYSLVSNFSSNVPDQLNNANTAFSSSNYFCISSEQDNRAAILGHLPDYTAFYILTHGANWNFGDCYWDINNANDDDIVFANSITDKTGKIFYAGQNVADAVATKNNNPNIPPYNFVWLDACETSGLTGSAVSSTFLTAFGFSQGGSDRAFVGWHKEVIGTGTENADWKSRVWQHLTEGDTILEAFVKSSSEEPPLGELVRGDKTNLGPVFPVIQGDSRTKIHGVYKGRTADWFKAL